MELIEARIPWCYVAVGPDGNPCFMQWLISHDVNDMVKTYYKGYFPPLAPDEVLLEGAFVSERYRGKGVMADAMSRVAEKGGELGARWAITYVKVPTCLRSGVAWRAAFIPS